jgi:hypothetical protein
MAPWQRELGKQRPALRGMGPRAEAWRRQQAAPPWAGPRFHGPSGDRERWNLRAMPFGREARPERGDGWREGPRGGGRSELWERRGGPPRMKDDDKERPRVEKEKKEKAEKGPKSKPRDKDKDDRDDDDDK